MMTNDGNGDAAWDLELRARAESMFPGMSRVVRDVRAAVEALWSFVGQWALDDVGVVHVQQQIRMGSANWSQRTPAAVTDHQTYRLADSTVHEITVRLAASDDEEGEKEEEVSSLSFALLVDQGPKGVVPEWHALPMSATGGRVLGVFETQFLHSTAGEYALISGDHNPIHFDAAAARAGGLDAPIVPGLRSLLAGVSGFSKDVPELTQSTQVVARFTAPVVYERPTVFRLSSRREDVWCLSGVQDDRTVLKARLST